MFFNHWRARKDVFWLIMWLYGLSRMIGNWPFSIQFNAKRELSKIHVTWTDRLWFIVSLLFYGLIVWVTILHNFNKVTVHFFEFFISQSVQVSTMIIIMISVISDMINRNMLWNIVMNFHEFDEEVISLKQKPAPTGIF